MLDLINLVWLIGLTFTFGPFGSIPYAFGHGLGTLETAITVSAIHAALVPIWFLIFRLVKYGLLYEHRLTHKFTQAALIRSRRFRRDIDGSVQQFEKRVGQKGLGLGVIGFTFLFGIFWAALAASILNIKKNTIMGSIAIGSVVSSVFWTFTFGGIGELLPSPWLLYLVGLIITAAIFVRQKIKERRLLREIAAKVKSTRLVK